MDPVKFESCFRNWVGSLLGSTAAGLISIDGKTIRGAKNHGLKSPVHMVSAWAGEHNMVLGQIRVNEKTNEITAIPELLKSLFIKGSLISIDAMGCQEDIAECIVNEKGDYLLAVKNNQASLYQNIEDSFRFLKAESCDEDIDIGHGRIETRKCTVITNLSHIEAPKRWKNLNVLIKMENERCFKASGKTEKSVRYYIGSKPGDASFYQQNIRRHWEIENKLHWALDIDFREDDDRKRNKNSAQNFSLANKLALNILKNDQTKNISIRRKMNIAALDLKYLLVLMKF
jgi:predicted transposase YbfD/YdcC